MKPNSDYYQHSTSGDLMMPCKECRLKRKRERRAARMAAEKSIGERLDGLEEAFDALHEIVWDIRRAAIERGVRFD